MPLGWGYGTVLTRYNVSYNALQAANPDVDKRDTGGRAKAVHTARGVREGYARTARDRM